MHYLHKCIFTDDRTKEMLCNMQNPISRAFHPYNHTTTSLGTQFWIDEISHILHSSISSSSYSIILLQVHFRAVQSNKSHPPRFLGSDDITNFFSRAQRSRIVFEILSTTPFGREKKGEVRNFLSTKISANFQFIKNWPCPGWGDKSSWRGCLLCSFSSPWCE